MVRPDPLYVTDAEIAARLGLPVDDWKLALPALMKQGFPQPEPLFKNRRYWPACRAFLDRRYQLGAQSTSGTPALDGEERWNEHQRPAKRPA